ncbi:MAG TPA: TonB-dependent receptor [Chitinophagaceae bacterium]
MSKLFRLLAFAGCCIIVTAATAQEDYILKGKVVDSATMEPVSGATIRCTAAGCSCGCISAQNGAFEIRCSRSADFMVKLVGYQPRFVHGSGDMVILLAPSGTLLQEVVVTANRGEQVRRAEAPIAIATVNAKTIQETKAISADQLLNKVSGVHMVSLGNEQHQMSIRQPVTTRSLFLYLEDGIPIRTSGLFNHNALLEMNLAATRSIEVIKGPSSSLYGSEAIGGVVNFITMSPSAVPLLKVSLQANDIGYRKAELAASVSGSRTGVVLSGYHAEKRNGYPGYSDFRKGVVTLRADHRFSARTTLVTSFTWLNYYSEMSGSVDSTMYASRSFRNLHSFTYRAVYALRLRATLVQQWSETDKTSVTAATRNNQIAQNPAYRVRDDYRKSGGVYVGKKDLAHGEINDNSFHSLSLVAQHRKTFKWKKSVLLAGVNIETTPSGYAARYIRITRDTVSRRYIAYQSTDSILTDYHTQLDNYAAFLAFECSPVEQLRVVASLRNDYFRYRFTNHLKPSAYSGSRDTATGFYRFSPKIGLTWNFSKRFGVYANYSEGFVPPQVTELFTGVKVPDLRASVFYNYECGGWAERLRGRLSVDFSVYHLAGSNEVISVKLDDGTQENRNAGKTLHRGIELGVNSTPFKNFNLRLSGTCSDHVFIRHEEKGVNYSGKKMNNAPAVVCNVEGWYKPALLKGFRFGAEWQHVGKYFADAQNSAEYPGYDVIHLRAGYEYRGLGIWLNLMNATNAYYATNASKSGYGYSYQLADKRNLGIGLQYDFAKLLKPKQ